MEWTRYPGSRRDTRGLQARLQVLAVVTAWPAP
jgi:hypothetical protein